ncbi:hypothetical protein L6452_16893 [Arctium lappa]|uniref:Uncharacterized protein n=1 Tax=Arctium lappa TaxID=4217 RepID=A0ACB9C206_ARCLA|nr:hypothetical protein L6452_16893 [Arctium lappa]
MKDRRSLQNQDNYSGDMISKMINRGKGEKEIPLEEIGVADIDGDGCRERKSSDNNHHERRSEWETMSLEEEMHWRMRTT